MYDNPNRQKYTFPQLDFGAGADTFAITGPKGKKGRLIDYGVEHITEAFTNDTTGATLSVGDGSDADAYGEEFDLGTAAINSGTKSVRQTYKPTEAGFAALMLEAGQKIPADSTVVLTAVSPTGGTPAGIAVPFMIIDWEN